MISAMTCTVRLGGCAARGVAIARQSPLRVEAGEARSKIGFGLAALAGFDTLSAFENDVVEDAAGIGDAVEGGHEANPWLMIRSRP